MKKILTILLLSLSNLAFSQVKFNKLSAKVFHIVDEKTSVKATLIIDGKEVILIDGMFDSFAKEIKEYIEKENLTLKFIINTHYHGDHTGGNEQFKGIDIIAHRNTYQSILDSAQYGPPASFTKEDLPNILFENQLILFVNNTKLEVSYYGPAHTEGDAIVFIPSENIVCIGDIILDAKNTLPFASYPEEMVSALKKVVSKTDEKTKIITGHGKIATQKDVEDLMEIMANTIQYVKKGNDITNYPEEWKQWDSQFLTMDNWLKYLLEK